jgi:hypothetical protein
LFKEDSSIIFASEADVNSSYFPEFSYFQESSRPDFDHPIQTQVNQIDSILQKMFATADQGQTNTPDLLKVELEKEFMILAQRLKAAPHLSDLMKQDLVFGLETAQKMIEQTVLFRLNRGKRPLKTEIGRALQDQGFWASSLESKWVNDLANSLKEKYYAQLISQFHPANRMNFVALREGSAEFKTITDLFHQIGMFSAVREYFGFPIRVFFAAMILNKEGEDWYQPLNSNEKLNHFHYLHFDGDPNVIKAIIYLQDVNIEQGPFKFIRRDGLPLKKDFGYFISLANDEIFRRRFNQKEGRYYRKIFVGNNFDYFKAMPRSFQRLSHFGDDIPSGSAMEEQFKQNEMVMDSSKGQLMAFDGSSLLHRGGQVLKGERLAMQMAFKPLMNLQEYKEHYVHRVKSGVVDILRSVGLK